MPDVADTPRIRRHQRTRDAILEAARRLLVTKGQDGLSVRAIARAIDFSPAALYEYFDGKDGILEALGAEALDQLEIQLRDVPRDMPAQPRLEAYCHTYIQFALEETPYFWLLAGPVSSTQQKPQEKSLHHILFPNLLRAVRDLLSEALGRTAPLLTAERTALGIWSLSHGMAMLQLTQLSQHRADFSAANQLLIRDLLASATQPRKADPIS